MSTISDNAEYIIVAMVAGAIAVVTIWPWFWLPSMLAGLAVSFFILPIFAIRELSNREKHKGNKAKTR